MIIENTDELKLKDKKLPQNDMERKIGYFRLLF